MKNKAFLTFLSLNKGTWVETRLHQKETHGFLGADVIGFKSYPIYEKKMPNNNNNTPALVSKF